MAIPDDFDLRDFGGLARLFPLPNVVLFPHNILPLHIFEPRYRQMTEDALAGDKLVTIVQVPSPIEWLPSGEPRIEEIACLGRIVQHERLPDGRFNMLLLGRKRVRLVREIPGGKLYRTAEVEVVEDRPEDDDAEAGGAELTRLFRAVLGQAGSVDPDLSSMLEKDLPLGTLTDVVAHALGLPPALAQRLLAESRPGRRSRDLVAILRQVLVPGPTSGATPTDRHFPPDFSVN